MKSRKFNPFNEVALQSVPSSTFDLSHDIKTSFNPGKLIPLPAIECYPGDYFNINVENMFRFAPLIAPVMHRMRIKTQFFFVPNRLIWPDFEDWIRGESELEAPYIEFTNTYGGLKYFPVGTIADYLGYPTQNTAFAQDATRNVKMSPLPIYAYWKVWWDWYRSEILQAGNSPIEEAIKARPGQNLTDIGVLRDSILNSNPLNANYEMDYFTACLPEPQNGDPVLIPLFDSTNLDPAVYMDPTMTTGGQWRQASNNAPFIGGGTASAVAGSSASAIGGVNARYDPAGTIKIDLSDLNLNAGTIHDLTLARVTQNFLDRQMRAGNTYKDFIYAHFQTRTKDATIQRAEFLGTVTQNMLISETLSTAQTEELPQGNMAGHGISAAKANGVSYKCTEYGWIIPIMYAVQDTAYFQGLHKSLTRFDQLDYMIPGFANIGEQPVYKKEIFVTDDDPAQNEEVFGYLPIYSDLRYIPSKVTGEMRTSLLFYHWARSWEEAPNLNAQFVTAADVPLRTFAVTDSSHKIWAHIYLEITANRKLPKYGIPRN